MDHKSDRNFILDPFVGRLSGIENMPYKMFVLGKVGLQVQTELARVDWRPHGDPKAIQVVEGFCHQVVALKSAEHVVDRNEARLLLNKGSSHIQIGLLTFVAFNR